MRSLAQAMMRPRMSRSSRAPPVEKSQRASFYTSPPRTPDELAARRGFGFDVGWLGLAPTRASLRDPSPDAVIMVFFFYWGGELRFAHRPCAGMGV